MEVASPFNKSLVLAVRKSYRCRLCFDKGVLSRDAKSAVATILLFKHIKSGFYVMVYVVMREIRVKRYRIRDTFNSLFISLACLYQSIQGNKCGLQNY